jgi:hypothetical protein
MWLCVCLTMTMMCGSSARKAVMSFTFGYVPIPYTRDTKRDFVIGRQRSTPFSALPASCPSSGVCSESLQHWLNNEAEPSLPPPASCPSGLGYCISDGGLINYISVFTLKWLIMRASLPYCCESTPNKSSTPDSRRLQPQTEPQIGDTKGSNASATCRMSFSEASLFLL